MYLIMKASHSNTPIVYDEIADKYQMSESASIRKNKIKSRYGRFIRAENPSSLLDLGCGTGVFPIIAKEIGVNRVVGIDISSAQIKIARRRGLSSGLRIEYFTQDITYTDIEERFDAVSSIFGFCYAATLRILQKQLLSAFQHLNDEGVIFATVCHPQHPTRDRGEGYRVYATGALKDGTKLKCDFLLDGITVATDYKFYWTAQTWSRALEDIGFSDITWEELDEYSTNIILIARKQKSKREPKPQRPYG